MKTVTDNTKLRLMKSKLPGLYDLKKIWNPSWFQGNLKKSRYFEGWYFKIASENSKHTWAFIPGVSLADGDDHSFVQAINGKTGQSWYFRYPLDAFSYSEKGFGVWVGNSYFSAEEIHLQLRDDNSLFSGRVEFANRVSFLAGLRKPGIMGWYRYVPFMECYHGVVSLDHKLQGELQINNQKFLFNNGRGYIEKDWGRSMPKAWIWMQSNHFDIPGTSLMLSVARIPWLGSSFTGFLGFLLHKGKRYDFATYTGAKLTILENSDEKLVILIKGKDFLLELITGASRTGSLKAPVSGNMHRVIHESIDASIRIKLSDRTGQVIYEGTGQNAGFEKVGDQHLLSH